jgi:hypothetical protein
VKHDPFGRDAGGKGNVQFATGRNIERKALFGGEAGHRGTEEGFGRVGDPVVPGLSRLSASRSKVVLVVDEKRCPVTGCEVEQIDPADLK